VFLVAKPWSSDWRYRVSQARNPEACRCFLAWLIIRTWRWKRYVPPKRPAIYILYGITAQKTAVFRVNSHERLKSNTIPLRLSTNFLRSRNLYI
jgi:hypothetical protein